MESRPFHYSILAGIGALHLAALMWQPATAPAITPPVLLPLTMIDVSTPTIQHPSTRAPMQQKMPQIRKPVPAKQPVPTASTSKPTRVASSLVTTPSVVAPAPSAAPGQTFTAPSPVAGAVSQDKPVAEQPLTLPTLAGNYLNNPKPEYPPASLELEEEGTVLIRVLVSTAGRASNVAVQRSSGYPRLDNAARRAVAGWTFIPARRGNEPVEHPYTVPVEFIHPKHKV